MADQKKELRSSVRLLIFLHLHPFNVQPNLGDKVHSFRQNSLPDGDP